MVPAQLQLIRSLCCAALFFCSSCNTKKEASHTQPATTGIQLQIQAEPDIAAATTLLHVEAEGYSTPTGPVTERDSEIDAPTFPVTILLEPRAGSTDRKFQLTVTAYDTSGPLAQARMRSAYLPDGVRYARLWLEDACIAQDCDALLAEENEEAGAGTAPLACRGGRCVDAEVPVSSLSDNPSKPTEIYGREGAGATGGDSNSATGGDSHDGSGSSDTNTLDASVGTETGGTDLSCPSSQTPCAETCVDLTSAAAHCGRCNRACATGTCNGGACTAARVGFVDTRGTFAVRPPYLYSTAGDYSENAKRTLLSDPTTSESFSTSLPGSENPRLVATADYLYTTFSNILYQAPYTTGVFKPAPGGTLDWDIYQNWWRVAGCSQYVIASTKVSDHVVVHVLPTDSSTRREIDSGSAIVPKGLACDNTYGFYIRENTIYRTPLSGGTPVSLLPLDATEATESWLENPLLAVTSNHVIIALPDRVVSIPKSGGTLTTLASRSALALATDGGHVYFSSEDKASCEQAGVYHVPAAGGVLTRLGSTDGCPEAMAAGPNRIYLQLRPGALMAVER